MKRKPGFPLLILFLLLAPLAGEAQEQTAALSTGRSGASPAYLFADFSEATILLKSGIRVLLPLNYNVVTEEMVFYRNDKLLAIDMPNVDTIYLNHKKFVPFNEAYVEVLPTPPGVLYIRHRSIILNKGKAAGYGGYLETAAISSLASITLTDQVVPLKVDAGTRLYDVTSLWIRRRGQFFEANTVKQLQQAFPDHKHTIRQYAKEHHIDRFRVEDFLAMARLF